MRIILGEEILKITKENDLKRELEKVKKKEERFLNRSSLRNPLKEAVYEKVPEKLQKVLEGAFERAFEIVFQKGTAVIEKTFDREGAALEFEAADYVVGRHPGKKSLRRMEKQAKRGNKVNTAAAVASGLGLGLLGLGIPDIPLIVGTTLKGIYEIALGYGFHYEEEGEKIYILKMIRSALSEGEERRRWNREMDEMTCLGEICIPASKEELEEEIRLTARVLSNALLVEKFVQGVPVIGIVGGAVNAAVYRKVSWLAGMKYEERYLERMIGGSFEK